MKKILENDFATLVIYPEKGIIHHTFHKFIFGEHFQEAMTKGADAFVANNCSKWLSDDRGNAALRQQDAEWGREFWENRILGAGWKYWAVIPPVKAIGKLNIKAFIERYKSKGVVVEIFDNLDSALKWLESK
ncbi:MAG: hypothetical protein SCALA702_04210 [Melioribacteraceae bacterium]|nr:MAG: hypothetical protein SCALA702_04210 [Melioribacteraceae bacterium]